MRPAAPGRTAAPQPPVRGRGMTDEHARGASSGLDAARRALRELVMAATVRIHRAGVGYAIEEPGTFLGSGFFVAPNWVLTCAHVARAGEGDEVTVVYETGPGRGGAAVAGTVAATVPEHAEGAPRGNWPALTSRSSSCASRSTTTASMSPSGLPRTTARAGCSTPDGP